MTGLRPSEIFSVPGLLGRGAQFFGEVDSDKPGSPTIRARVLVDTGATWTCIRQGMSSTLGLDPIRKQSTTTASGQSVVCDVFKVRLRVGTTRIRLEAIELPLFPEIDVALGRDFLSHGVMVYDGLNETISLQFREANEEDVRRLTP